MGWDVVHEHDLAWEERPGHDGEEPRHAASLTDAAWRGACPSWPGRSSQARSA